MPGGGREFPPCYDSSMPDLRELNGEELQAFVEENGESLLEEEALQVLANRYCSPAVALRVAANPRLTSFYSVRAALVRHRATPQGHALKLLHHLYWVDLLKFSVDMTVSPGIRRAIDQQMLTRLPKLTLGEKITSARSCSRDLIKALIVDPSARVFEALLINPRLTEPDLLTLIGSNRASPPQLTLIAGSRKWAFRIAIRRALVLNADTPRAVAASQLLHLSAADLAALHSHPEVSTYLKRCIERLPGRR